MCGAIVATAVGVPIQISMAIVAVGLIPAAVLYVHSIREAKVASADDPFDPVEVARRRLDHAVEWHRRGLDRLVVSEVVSVLELARAAGGVVGDDPPTASTTSASPSSTAGTPTPTCSTSRSRGSTS